MALAFEARPAVETVVVGKHGVGVLPRVHFSGASSSSSVLAWGVRPLSSNAWGLRLQSSTLSSSVPANFHHEAALCEGPDAHSTTSEHVRARGRSGGADARPAVATRCAIASSARQGPIKASRLGSK